MEIYEIMKVGDLVECITTYSESNAKSLFGFDVGIPVENKIYTIRGIKTILDFKGIVLEEIVNQELETELFGRVEIQFDSACFRLLPEADLSELKELL
jgi:hypothetical protein